MESVVIVYLLIPGRNTDRARATLTRDPEWAAPVLWRSEFRNVLSLYLRKGELSLRSANALQDAAEELLAGREHVVVSHEVLALAKTSERSAYDCELVAVARSIGVRLVTSDRQLLTRFPDDAVALQVFGSAGGDA